MSAKHKHKTAHVHPFEPTLTAHEKWRNRFFRKGAYSLGFLQIIKIFYERNLISHSDIRQFTKQIFDSQDIMLSSGKREKLSHKSGEGASETR